MEYDFSAGGSDTTMRRSFILPGETKTLVEVGATIPGGVADARLKIVSRSFYRIDRHAIPDYDAWSKSRLSIVALNPVFTPSDPSASVPASVTSFTLVNQTAYSYYDVDLVVSVYRGDSLQDVNTLRLDSLKAGESRPVQLYWYQNLQGITRIEVQPSINIFDPGVYQPPGA